VGVNGMGSSDSPDPKLWSVAPGRHAPQTEPLQPSTPALRGCTPSRARVASESSTMYYCDMKRLTAREALRRLLREGWQVVRQRGSHKHLKHPVLPGRITIADHAGDILDPKILRDIAKLAGWADVL